MQKLMNETYFNDSYYAKDVFRSIKIPRNLQFTIQTNI